MKSEGQVYLYKEYSVLNIACNLQWLNIPKIGTKNGQKDFIKFWLKLCAWNILFDENIHTFILTMFYLTSFFIPKTTKLRVKIQIFIYYGEYNCSCLHSIFFTTNNFDSRLNHTQNVLTTFSCSTRPVLQIILTRAWITLKFFLPFIPTTCPHTAWNERSVTWLLLKHLYLFGESRIGLSCIISRKQTHFCIANTRPIEQIPYTSSIPLIAQHILFVPRTTLKYRSVFLYNYGMKLLSSDEIILYSSGDNACKLLRKKNHE